jgi:DNA-binding transcriptional LysR family regulator
MPGIELRHLRYFVAVAEQGGFTPAARRLYVSQPAVSKTIRQLERELGTTLLRRHAGGVELTTEGESFLADTRVTLRLAARVEEVSRP